MTTHQEFVERFAARIRADQDVEALAALLIRTKSRPGRDLLAGGATGGALDADRLAALVSPSDLPSRALVGRAAAYDPQWLLQLARVVALQQLDDTDRGLAIGLFGLVRAAHGSKVLTAEAAGLYAQLLAQDRQFDRLRSVLPRLDVSRSQRWALELDLANPFTGAADSPDAWLRRLNQAFTRHRLEPVTFDGTGETPFERLTATPSSTVDDDSLVTVVMSAFHPGPGILSAARAVLAQSWRNLELLVVDDASPSEYADVLSQVAALDPRVRVLTMPDNGGTYRVRNLALDHARGEYVTFQDSDDWSHPRRVERQVAALRADESLLATRSTALRAYPELTFTYPGYPPRRVNASSLLFRREPVHELVGYFDPVRRSADMELPARLRALRERSVRNLSERVPLAITQLRPGSLSREDTTPGWTRWTRIAYFDAYTHWHTEIRGYGASPRISPDPDAPRPFPPPDPSWVGRPRRDVSPRHYDVVLFNDWRAARGPQRRLLGDLDVLCSLGLRVGVAHAETARPLVARRDPLGAGLQRLVNSRAVDLVHVEQDVSTDLLLVGDPAVLQLLPGCPRRLRAERVAILVDRASAARVGVDFRPADCVDHAEQLFGRRPVWVPRDAETRGRLAGGLNGDALATADLPPAIDPARLYSSGRRPGRSRPVIGRHVPDRTGSWPATREDLLAAYPDDGRFDVRIMGGADTPGRLLGRAHLPASWVTYPGERQSDRAFLAQLDYFVYFPHPEAGEQDPWPTLQAMAAGCVVVLPPMLETTFADGAAYVEPAGVRDLVDRLHRSPQEYADQQRRGRQLAEQRSGLPEFRDALGHLLPS